MNALRNPKPAKTRSLAKWKMDAERKTLRYWWNTRGRHCAIPRFSP